MIPPVICLINKCTRAEKMYPWFMFRCLFWSLKRNRVKLKIEHDACYSVVIQQLCILYDKNAYYTFPFCKHFDENLTRFLPMHPCVCSNKCAEQISIPCHSHIGSLFLYWFSVSIGLKDFVRAGGCVHGQPSCFRSDHLSCLAQ